MSEVQADFRVLRVPRQPSWRLVKGRVMDSSYLEVVSLIERLHRQFLEVVKLELEGSRVHDVNNVQALMLFNIGDAEMTVGELTSRGCYLGSNVSYNVSKLAENGYLAADRSEHDRRSVRVRLTDKGRQLRDVVSAMYQRHIEMLGRTSITEDDLEGATTMLERLERFWSEASNPYRRGVVLSDTAGE